MANRASFLADPYQACQGLDGSRGLNGFLADCRICVPNEQRVAFMFFNPCILASV